ncbi:penicillin-binding protein, 1A family [Ammonifex degensii KC4]|uniref:Penicillin-binding protein 1A n=1 Tax=Ammonifex degensii (strain DSM 10501 / KC4) TaxID=429009 RepID=C9RBC1_AMMDK|nr:PBP1A family penicillin-binding protein [Ammonifex degensii]ACX51548.1 penicillin-binding protein, 1A family [Ammonifex degensii KC4]
MWGFSWVRLVGWLLALFLLLGTCWGGYEVYAAIRDLPPWQIDSVPLVAPSTLYAADGTPFATLGRGTFIPVTEKEIPLVVKQAFVAAEDNRFYQHHGIDIWGILRAAWYDLLNRKIVQGGSTITQQLAKNAFLTPSRTFKRKIQEIFLAIQLERHYTKDEILTFYLNRIYFGEGAWGIGAAAKTYFDKKVEDLTPAEAAMLAGLVRAPSYYDPFRNPEGALARRNTVLQQMEECGFLTPEQVAKAKAEPLGLKRGLIYKPECPYPDFVDYVIATVGERFGESALFRGGLKIYTTLDIKAQRAAEAAVKNNTFYPTTVRDSQGLLQPQAAVVLLDPNTGAIRAMVGGREHVVSRQFNRAYQAYRSPGSAIKPILDYAPAVEYLGMSPSSIVVDEPVRFGSYEPRNYDGRYRGPITLQDALAYSVNVVAVKLLHMVGLERAAAFARNLGIEVDPAKDGLAAALGGLHHGVSPLQMAAAYAAFANGGYYVRPFAVTKIVQPDGSILAEYHPELKPVMKPETAAAITTMLKAAVRYGTGTKARIGDLVAGKTGTTDEGRDLWFCGWVPRMVGVVWIGWDMPRAMPGAYGGDYCAKMWRQIMVQALDLQSTPRLLPSPPAPTTTPAPPVPTTPTEPSTPSTPPPSAPEKPALTPEKPSAPTTPTSPAPATPEQSGQTGQSEQPKQLVPPSPLPTSPGSTPPGTPPAAQGAGGHG